MPNVDIDDLSIRITSDASSASDGVDKLVKQLEKLEQHLSGNIGQELQQIATGMSSLAFAAVQFKSINASVFTKVAKGLDKLAVVNSSGLKSTSVELTDFSTSVNSLAQTLVGGVGDNLISFAKALAKLGSKSVESAITNIPRLVVPLEQLMNSLAKAPKVSSGTISLINALASLSSQGSKVGSAVRGLGRYFNTTGVHMMTLRKRTMSLARSFGLLYANFWIFIRGLKGIGKSIGQAGDFYEAKNYFDVAVDKVSLDSYRKFGYESAEAYASAYKERIAELNNQMSAIRIGENADGSQFFESNGANLGLNITDLTQYQAALTSVTNSLGFTGEASAATTKALSMLSADLSSLKNVDTETAMSNLTSALLGQTRVAYKYGVDLTNARLAQYAFALGIEKSVSEMTQSEKAQLRVLALLDQTKVAYGDMANTVNSLSNQVRILKNNWNAFCTVLGNLFVPIASKVLPVINGLVVALQRLLNTIGKLFGVSIKSQNTGSGLADYYDDLEEGADASTDSIKDATKAAKEYKNTVMGFDELNRLNDVSDNSGAGSGSAGAGAPLDLSDLIDDALGDYESIWDQAMSNMEDRISDWADFFESKLEIVKKLFNDIKLGDWFAVGEDVSRIVSGIFNFLSDAISQVDWHGIGSKIGEFLEGLDWSEILASVARFFWEALSAAIELWSGSFLTAPVETALLTAFGLLNFTPLGGLFMGKIESVFAPAIASISEMFNIANLAILGGIGLAVGEFVSMWNDGFSWAKELLMLLGIAIVTFVVGFIAPIPGTVVLIVGGIVAALATLVAYFKEDFFEAVLQTIGFIGDFLMGVFLGTVTLVVGSIITVVQTAWGIVKSIVTGIWDVLSGLGLFIKGAFLGDWNMMCQGLRNAFASVGNMIIGIAESIANGFVGLINTVIRGINAMQINVPAWVTKLTGISTFGFHLNLIPNVRLPRFENGGYIEDGLFTMNSGEIAGRFNNGKSVVANNYQIIEGIKQGVTDAMMDVYMATGGSGDNAPTIEFVWKSDSETLYRQTIKGKNKYNGRYHVVAEY